MNLSQFQHSIVTSLYSGESLPSGLVCGDEKSSGFSVYRANLKGNLGSALRDTYPVIAQLTGEDFFDLCARHYWQTYHSLSGDLHHYGEHFADFLISIEDKHGLPYLADVARLEWLAHRAFHAADARHRGIAALQTLTERQLSSLQLTLHPSVQLLTSDFPVHRIWQVNQENYQGDGRVDLDEGSVHLLIFRSSLEIIAMPVTPGLFQMVQALASGESLATALSIALEMDQTFNPEKALFQLFEQQLITGIDHFHFINKNQT